MPRFIFNIILLICLINVPLSVLHAQLQPSQEPDSSTIEILHISKLRERTTSAGIFRDLIGDVHLRQKKMHLWCDVGLIKPMKQVTAYGQVHMRQEDSIHVYSDSLYYDGITRNAQLQQHVRLIDTNMVLYTDVLDYDLNTKIAFFPNQSRIVSDSSTLISKRGYYQVNKHRAHFEDSVRINNPNFQLTADSLDYDTQSEIAYFLGPTHVFNKTKRVYCEDGFYNAKSNYAELYQNARFENNEEDKQELATADTILYNGEEDVYYLIGHAFYQNEEQEVYADTIFIDNQTETFTFWGHPKFISRDSSNSQSIDANFSFYDAVNKRMIFREEVQIYQESQRIRCDSLDYYTDSKNGWAQGNVVWEDTAAQLQIQCQEAFYNDSTKYLQAQGMPVLRTMIDGDTLWLRADSLWAYPDSMESEQRNIKAYHKVRIYKSNMQVYCDSLYYDGRDSTFQFFHQPILWVDETQFTADTIHVQLRNNQLNKVWLFAQSFIVNTNDSVYFNQIKGDDVVTSFEAGTLSLMSVYKAGETVYYAVDDEDRYIGVNDVDCIDMHLFFENNAVRSIRFEQAPKAVLYPMHQVNHKGLRLSGFKWLDALRLRSKYAVLNYNTSADKGNLLYPLEKSPVKPSNTEEAPQRNSETESDSKKGPKSDNKATDLDKK